MIYIETFNYLIKHDLLSKSAILGRSEIGRYFSLIIILALSPFLNKESISTNFGLSAKIPLLLTLFMNSPIDTAISFNVIFCNYTIS